MMEPEEGFSDERDPLWIKRMSYFEDPELVAHYESMIRITNTSELTPAQREQKKLAREEYLRNEELPLEQRTSRYYKPYEQPSKFLDVGYEFIHAKGIQIEYWDEAETEEFCVLMEQKMAKLKDREKERVISKNSC